jgi:antitoxin ParD1/3/4
MVTNINMNIPFTPELEQFIENQVTSGKYASTEEVIIAGIELLEERERTYKGRYEELKREIIVGVEALERGEVIDAELVFTELEEDTRQIEAEKRQVC